MHSNVGASLLAMRPTRCFRLKHRVAYNSAIDPAKELPMAFKLIEHVTGDLILGEAHQVVVLATVVQIHFGTIVTVSYTHLTLPTTPYV